ncbi:hypothetical protein E1B28_012043 [Marasmius oreades]|uniref:Uncharacterized protein n=1 Tax=Marasmius oreades TaxID=181124 RepID=A0A9P7RQQ8_9AGAR|nr:uncharacterized protein E1B28_012043 [Marasmius oreades]KAG7088004.1 hypothetical protein E1B28_012043 [Marasmius oreades]
MFNHSYSNQVGSATLNNIQGNQHNHTYYLQQQHQPVPAHAAGEEWKMKMYLEYDRFPRGRIKVLRTVDVRGVSRGEYEDDPDHLESDERYDTSRANRVARLACLVEGMRESSPFLCVEYTGSDAQKLFKRDCLAFSRSRHAYAMQLRGFNDSDIPMVLFHEELIPVHHVFQRHRESSIALQCYFSLQASVALATMRSLHHCLESYLCHNVWIQPRNGRIFFGPAGPWPTDQTFLVLESVQWQLEHYSDIPVLSTGMYNAGYVLDYLVQFSTDEFFLQHFVWDAGTHIYQGQKSPPPSLQVWALSCGNSIARLESRWMYNTSIFDRDLLPIIMENGRARFSIKYIPPPGLWEWDLPKLLYQRDTTYSDGYQNWLSQAFRFFSALNIPRSDWSDYALIHSIHLELIPTFDCDRGAKSDFIPLDMIDDETLYYLFLNPPPQFPDSSPDVNAWMRGKKQYYWSTDPEGRSAMPEDQHLSLGLPSFIPDVWAEYYTWSADTYDLIRAWQEMKCFDPSTTEFARSLGYPIMELISPDSMDANEGRFKILSEDTDLPSSLDGVGSEGEGVMDVDSMASLSHSTMEADDYGAPGTDMEVD